MCVQKVLTPPFIRGPGDFEVAPWEIPLTLLDKEGEEETLGVSQTPSEPSVPQGTVSGRPPQAFLSGRGQERHTTARSLPCTMQLTGPAFYDTRCMRRECCLSRVVLAQEVIPWPRHTRRSVSPSAAPKDPRKSAAQRCIPPISACPGYWWANVCVARTLMLESNPSMPRRRAGCQACMPC